MGKFIWAAVSQPIADDLEDNPIGIELAMDSMNDDLVEAGFNVDEMGTDTMRSRWVIIDYVPHEPSHVYGTFATEKAAMDYAARQGFGISGAYEVKNILEINEEE
jgi:hypothetical protein